MSIGYAELLAPRVDVGGTLGGPEMHEGAKGLLLKMSALAAMIRSAKAALESGTPLEMPAPPQRPQPKKKKTTPPPPTTQPQPPPPRLLWDPTRPHASPLVVFTGAGLSTSCGIPDFRGPNGVWTLRSKGLPLPAAAVSFTHARPSLAHMALVKLHSEGYLSLVVSQNVDGLHLRSGLPRDALAELHGDCFAERCAECGGEFVRDFEMPSVGFKPTGRLCSHPLSSSSSSGGKKKTTMKGKSAAATAAAAPALSSFPVPACFVANGNPPTTELLGAALPPHHHHESHRCNGPLQDQCLDWDDPLPPKELREAEKRASAAAVALCLGTSLQIRPAGDLPLRAPRGGGALVIVNLQETPKDKKAAVVCRARCDEAAAALLDALGLEAPDFCRRDRVLVSHTWRKKGDGASLLWDLELAIGSVHGAGLPLPPTVRRVEVFFEEEEEEEGDEEKDGGLVAPHASFDLSVERTTPLVVRRPGFASNPATAVLRLTLVVDDDDNDGGAEPPPRVRVLRHALPAPPPPPPSSSSSSSGASPAHHGAATLTFETQRVAYGARQRAIVEELRRRAAREDEEGPPTKREEAEAPLPPPPPRRPRAPASQWYGEREAFEDEEEQEEQEDDDDGSDDDFVPSRACRASAAAAAGARRRSSGGSARPSSSRPRKAAKMLDV